MSGADSDLGNGTLYASDCTPARNASSPATRAVCALAACCRCACACAATNRQTASLTTKDASPSGPNPNIRASGGRSH